MEAQDDHPDINAIQETIEFYFRRHAGSVANIIIPKAEAQWRATHPKRLATIISYIRILSSYIVIEEIREQFYLDATQILV